MKLDVVQQNRISLLQRLRDKRKLGLSSSEAGKIALVMIEYQNEFTSEGGKMHGSVKQARQ